jgi:hypothetical protein
MFKTDRNDTISGASGLGERQLFSMPNVFLTHLRWIHR